MAVLIRGVQSGASAGKAALVRGAGRRGDGVAVLICGALAMCAVACTPEIGPGTYYCGPDRLCPPGQTCDEPSFTCRSPVSARPFACPVGAEAAEPDDTLDQARDLGALSCGDPLLASDGFDGCVAGGGEVDAFVFRSETTCVGADPHIEIVLRFPIASVPLTVELLDADGAVVATGDDCTPIPDFTGTERRCISFVPDQPELYYVRVSDDPEGPDCEGQCRHNQYALAILYPLA